MRRSSRIPIALSVSIMTIRSVMALHQTVLVPGADHAIQGPPAQTAAEQPVPPSLPSLPEPMRPGGPDAWFWEEVMLTGEMGVLNFLADTQAIGNLIKRSTLASHKEMVELLPPEYAGKLEPKPAELPQFMADGVDVPKPEGKEVFVIPFGPDYEPKNGETAGQHAKAVPETKKWRAKLLARFTDTGRLVPPAAEKTLMASAKTFVTHEKDYALKVSDESELINQAVQVWEVAPPAEAPAQGVVVAAGSFVYVLFQPSMDPPSFLFADGNKYRHCGDSFLDMVSTVCEKVRAKLEETIDSALNPKATETPDTHDQINVNVKSFEWREKDAAKKTVTEIPVKKYDYELIDNASEGKIWGGADGLGTWLKANVLEGRYKEAKLRFAGFSAGATATEIMTMLYVEQFG